MHCTLDVKTGDAVVWRFETTRKCVHKIVCFGFSVPTIQQLSEEEEVALSPAIVVIFSFVCFCFVLSSHGPLTPLLPKPVNFPGRMIHGRACKESVFQSCNIDFQCYAFE